MHMTVIRVRNCESGLAKACCTQAGPAHAADHVEIAWTDESHFFLASATCSPHRCSKKRSESSDRNHELSNKDNNMLTNGSDRLLCDYFYHSS